MAEQRHEGLCCKNSVRTENSFWKGSSYAVTSKISIMNSTRSLTDPFSVVLQKVVEDRKLLVEGTNYAATLKISAMNLTRSLTDPFATFFTCPFLSIFMISQPFIERQSRVERATFPIPGLTGLFINLWSRSTRLLRYLFCRNSTDLDNVLFFLSSSTAVASAAFLSTLITRGS